jgi:hypothetical protein
MRGHKNPKAGTESFLLQSFAIPIPTASRYTHRPSFWRAHVVL